MRDPEDKGHLILDPETAPVIRKIYDMALDGWGCMRIAKQLMDDKIPITRVKSNTECDVNYYSWGSARISHILRNPFYKGAHLVCRTHQKGIRSNTYDIIPREDWEIIENCHEAIVTPEEWDKVQELIDGRPAIMEGNACSIVQHLSYVIPYKSGFHIKTIIVCSKPRQYVCFSIHPFFFRGKSGSNSKPNFISCSVCTSQRLVGGNNSRGEIPFLQMFDVKI